MKEATITSIDQARTKRAVRSGTEILSRIELEQRVNRKKRTIFSWISEGMPVMQRSRGGHAFDWAAVKAWLERVKGWEFDETEPYDRQCTRTTEYGGQNHA